MRKSSIAGMLLTCGTIIVIGWQMGVQGVPTATAQVTTESPTTVSKAVTSPAPTVTPTQTANAVATSPSPVAATPTTAPTPSSNSTVITTETVTGDSVSTRFGSVQVSVTFNGNTITDVAALQLTDKDSKSVAISKRAAPTLKASVLKSQSAKVATVSGATYTSDAYLESVQSAIDKHNA